MLERVKKNILMRNPTPYLKMRVLGAIDMAPGHSIQSRIQAVSQMTFTDEDGHRSRPRPDAHRGP